MPTDVCSTWSVNQKAVNALKGKIPPLNRLAALFKVLADESRITIVWLLSKQELCVCDIAQLMGSSHSNVSHHLRQLRNAQLVRYRRSGKMVFYALDDKHVEQIVARGFEHISHG